MHDSAWGRLIAVLVSPIRTFQSIAERPTWVVPLVVLVALTLAANAVVFPRVDMAEVIRDATEAQGQQLSDGQIEQFAGIQGKLAFGCAVLLPPIGYLVIALILMAAFNLLGGEIKYPASFSVTLHSMMPWAVASVLTLPVALAQESIGFETLRTESILAANAAWLAPPDVGPVLLALLIRLDVFSLWALVLLALGFAAAAKVSRAKAAAVVAVLWLVYVGFRVGLAGIGAAFGGAGG